MDFNLLLEAEKRGILPENKRAILAEARKRGLIGGQAKSAKESSITETVKTAVSRAKDGSAPDISSFFTEEGYLGSPTITPSSGKFSLSNLIENLPGSGRETAKNIRGLLSDPVGTAETIGKTAIGTGQLLYPGEQELEKYPLALVQHYEDIAADPAKYAEENPIGLLSDLYAVTRGGVGLTRDAFRVGSKALPSTLPASLYQRGAKFSTTMPKEKRTAITKTALEGKFMPTDKGVEKLNNALTDYNTKANKLIDDATQTGKLIPRDEVYRNLKKLTDEVGGANFEAPSKLKSIANSIKKYEGYMKSRRQEFMTPREFQSFKTKLYEDIHWDAVRQTGEPITEALRKNLASGAKDSLEETIPGIADLNKKWSKPLSLKDSLQQSAARIENRNLFGLGEIAASGMGAGVGGLPGAVAGGLLYAMNHPAVSARSGISLHHLQNPATGLLRLKPRDAYLGLLQAGNIQGIIDQKQ